MTREEAISEWTFRSNHIKKWLDEYGEEPSIRHYVELIDMAIEALKDRPQGEWKHTITWKPYCSNCEYVFGDDEEFSPFWKFCPMCGAEMADNSLFNDITESLNDAIESQNDVIEVVRCRDCRWRKEECCGFLRFFDGGGMITKYDGYCSYGERREK